MRTKKPDKSVADMAVLKDIRGLLSTTLGQSPVTGAGSTAEPGFQAEKARLEARLKEYEDQVRRQQTALDRLEAQKRDLEAKLGALQSAGTPTAPLRASAQGPGRDVSDLEARKAELEAALSQIEGLLQIKIKELTRRIARVYTEAGDMGANRDFRRISDQLEASETFGEFVRALLGE